MEKHQKQHLLLSRCLNSVPLTQESRVSLGAEATLRIAIHKLGHDKDELHLVFHSSLVKSLKSVAKSL